MPRPATAIRLALTGLAAALLAGCATPIPEPRFADIDGMPIELVTQRIGLPDDSFFVNDRKIYIWRVEREYRRARFHPPGYYGWYGYPDSDYYTRRCALKLTVDRDERVVGWERDGYLPLCNLLSQDLVRRPGPPPS